ncbi:sensor histidine kinase [Portibacter lacus]|uniref:Histidine kinase n=1 Tax=Portibacter lacus TaxID=1099794 RepID=A0AA37WCI7_9BACT|nr:histidine kinase [Portibacter lacus]GLR16526.1 histidine kinase [Portibacter lacus]
MKLVNKERRIKYLGFDDKWFIIIGIIVLSFIADFIFSNSFGRDLPIEHALVSWSVSLFFSTLNWFAIREIMIQLRIRFPEYKDTFKRIILFSIAIILTVILIDTAGSAFLKKIAGLNFNHIEKSKIISIIIISMMTMSIYEAISFYAKLQKSIRDEEKAKRAIVQIQLDALRNQAQPHFLFNTLNTLRDIIDQNTKEEAKQFVDKIADVYRFILESGSANLIPLHDELKFAQSYLHIQSERFGENLKVVWDIPSKTLNLLIVPMSLQLLLENAIKHNVISKNKPLHISIQAADDLLIVKNKIQPKSTQMPSTKLGLKNIERRYALISHKSIEIVNDGEMFSIFLPLLNEADQKKIHEDINH